MTWALNSFELDEDTDWSFVDTMPEERWSYAFQNIASSTASGTGVFSGTDNDELHWRPGNQPGKGLVEDDGSVHTWFATGSLQEPWHFEYMKDNGIQHTLGLFYIDPDGGVYNLMTGADEEEDNRVRKIIADADPNLRIEQRGGWTFSRTSNLDGDVLNWNEGNYGKGLVDTHGNVHTWNEDEWELHKDYEIDHDVTGRFWFTIDPDGRIDSADMTPLDPGALDLISEADNNLYGEISTTWKF